jgi:hypothetical protein
MIDYCSRRIGLPTAPKRKRSGEVVGLAAASSLTDALQQPHALIAASLVIGFKPFGRTRQEIGFGEWLIGAISRSPNRRSQSRDELMLIGTTQFGLSKRRANALREFVVIQLGASAWSEAGAPRGRRRQT